MAKQSEDRINNLNMSVADLVITLAEGDPDALSVLSQWVGSDPMAVMQLLTLDTKRLYGSQIWVVYKDVCGEDLERFKYHVSVELPNQETGELSVTGPYSPSFDDKEFWAKRSCGKPGSFWALETPPSTPDYEYPIR